MADVTKSFTHHCVFGVPRLALTREFAARRAPALTAHDDERD